MIDWKRPIRTRKGEPAELIYTLEGEEYPRVVVIRGKNEPSVARYAEAGYYLDPKIESHRDLENVPEQTSFYLNVYKNKENMAHETLYDAAKGRMTVFSNDKIGGTLHLTFEGNHLVGVERVDD